MLDCRIVVLVWQRTARWYDMTIIWIRYDLEMKNWIISMKSCSFPEFPVDFYGSWLCCHRIRTSSDIHLKLQFAHCLAPPHGLKDFETSCFCLNLSGSPGCVFQPSAARQDPTSFLPHRTQCKLLKRWRLSQQSPPRPRSRLKTTLRREWWAFGAKTPKIATWTWISVATCWVQNIMLLLTGWVVAVCVLWLSWHPWPLSCTVIDFEKVGLSRCHDFPQTPKKRWSFGWHQKSPRCIFPQKPYHRFLRCAVLWPQRNAGGGGWLTICHDDFMDRWWPSRARCQAAASNFFCVTKAGKFSMQMGVSENG